MVLPLPPCWRWRCHWRGGGGAPGKLSGAASKRSPLLQLWAATHPRPPVLIPPSPSTLPCRRKIHNPRILLLDCPLEYKKGENQTNVELMREEDW